MTKRVHQSLLTQVLERFAFKHAGIGADLVDDPERQDKEASIDPSAFPRWLFLKRGDGCALHPESAKPGRRLHCRHGDLTAVLAMKSNAGGDVDVAQAVAIGHAKILVPLK